MRLSSPLSWGRGSCACTANEEVPSHHSCVPFPLMPFPLLCHPWWEYPSPTGSQYSLCDFVAWGTPSSHLFWPRPGNMSSGLTEPTHLPLT